MRLAHLSKLALAIVGLSLGQSAFSADWPTFGGDVASTKYIKLDDINAVDADTGLEKAPEADESPHRH